LDIAAYYVIMPQITTNAKEVIGRIKKQLFQILTLIVGVNNEKDTIYFTNGYFSKCIVLR